MTRSTFLIFVSDDALMPEEFDLEFLPVPEGQLDDAYLSMEHMRGELDPLAMEGEDDEDPAAISRDAERRTLRRNIIH